MIIVTGGAGFIGSVLVARLNELGETDILIVDEVDDDRKERNIGHLRYEELVGIADFRQKLLAGDYDSAGVDVIFHLGACSDTTETNWDYLEDNNVEYSKDIIRWCVDRGVRCVYASSAATYGLGEAGYSDDHELFDQLKPLNLYGKSKLAVDVWARDAGYLDEVVGLRYFNVFGPNEWHKGKMQSVIAKKFEEVCSGQPLRLFKSENDEYEDGEQKRDFIYVTDAVEATLFFWKNPAANGVFNIGTGKARSWNEVGRALFAALGQEENIEYVDLPLELKDTYQYFTEADIGKLKAAGFKQGFLPLDEAVADYVRNYLVLDKHMGE